MAVIIGHDARLALARTAAPLVVLDGAALEAAVGGVVDPGAVGRVGRGRELLVGVAYCFGYPC